MILAFFLCLIVLGYVSFCVPIGISVYKTKCIRKKNEIEKKTDSKLTSISAQPFWLLTRLFPNFKSSKKLYAQFWQSPYFYTNKTIAILVHSIGNNPKEMSHILEIYQKNNISTLSIHLRAHGNSDGRIFGLTHSLTDGLDIANWVHYLQNTFGTDIRIIGHGKDNGTDCLLHATNYYKIPVEVIIKEGNTINYCTQLKQLISNFLPRNVLAKPFTLGIYATLVICNVFCNGCTLKEKKENISVKCIRYNTQENLDEQKNFYQVISQYLND